MSIESVMPSNHFIFCHPLLLLPSIFPSIRVFSNDSCGQIIRASASASVLPMNIQDLFSVGLIGFDLLAVQGTFKSLLQHHNSKASILQNSAFFIVQLSYPYLTTGKTKVLTRRNFVSKVISLLFTMLSKFGHNFSFKEQTSFNFMAAVILEPPQNKVCHCFHCFPSYLP